MNNSLIVGNAYLDWFGNEITSLAPEILVAWDPLYYICFTLRPPKSKATTIRGLSLLLFVDQGLGVADGNFTGPSLAISAASGIRALVHGPGTAPDMSFGLNIGPGMETNILLTQTLRTRLGQPYSNCTNQQHLTGDNTSDAYTQLYCVNTCVQQQIVDKCGCISNVMTQYTMVQLRKVNYQICPAANDGTISACEESVIQSSVGAGCNAACVLPCSENQ